MKESRDMCEYSSNDFNYTLHLNFTVTTLDHIYIYMCGFLLDIPEILYFLQDPVVEQLHS